MCNFIADPLALTAEFLGLGSCTNSVANTSALTSNILPLANVGSGGGGIGGDNNSCTVVGMGNVMAGCGSGVSVGGALSHTNLDALKTNSSNSNSLAAAYMPLTPSSTQSSISPGNATSNPYDMFQVTESAARNVTLCINISIDCYRFWLLFLLCFC